MSKSKSIYENWVHEVDEESRKELISIENDPKEIEDRFYKNVEFGTGGLRGIMGVGSNRINIYTVRRATKGLADYLHHQYPDAIDRGVVIAYDSRHNSDLYAKEAAAILCSAGVPVKLFMNIEPTPVLSFSVKHFHALAGIVITASHNPKEYNGYKVYDEYGTQLVPEQAELLTTYIDSCDEIIKNKSIEYASLLSYIDEDLENLFIDKVMAQSLLRGNITPLKIVYTPLHGAGNIPVRKVLLKSGFLDVHIVKAQELPDGNFSTVKSPNPEEKATLSLGIKLGEEICADIVIGTDPDSDRIGVGVKTSQGFKLMTGNQIGALLVDFILTMRKNELSPQDTIIKTVVTGELGAVIAKAKGVKVVETLTGFKYIGEKITQYMNDYDHSFLMGYEESYGYLVGTHAQDKDAVVAALLICEMASYYKNKNMTLFDVLAKLYEQYGYYFDALDSYTLRGKDGAERIQKIMSILRGDALQKIFPNIDTVVDYNNDRTGLPKENMLKFIFEDGGWLAVRPSGTEPKIKIYYSIRGSDEISSQELIATYKYKMETLLEL